MTHLIIVYSAGNINSAVSYTYNPGGNVLTQTDGDGNVTSYGYDDENNLLSEVLRDQGNTVIRSTSWTYDMDNRVATATDGDGNVTHYTVSFRQACQNRAGRSATLAALLGEDRDACEQESRVAQGFIAGPPPVSGVASTLQEGRPRSTSPLGAGRPAGEGPCLRGLPAPCTPRA